MCEKKVKSPNESDPICPWYYTEYCQRPYKKEKSQSKKEKIELELDQDKKLAIDIISKAFKISPGVLIKKMINRDLAWIKQGISKGSVTEKELIDYYNLKEFSPEEFGKLFLVEEVI